MGHLIGNYDQAHITILFLFSQLDEVVHSINTATFILIISL